MASIVAGVSEAAVLALIVHVAAAMSGGSDPAALDLGPVSFETVPIPSAIAIAIALTVVRLVLQLVTAYLPARISADVQARLRTDAFAAFVNASWETQAKEREGHLQQVLGVQITRSTQTVLAFATGISSLFNFLVLVSGALILHPPAASLVIAAAGVLFFLLRPLSRLTRRASADLARATVEFSHGVAESVRMAEETKTFGTAGAERQRMALRVETMRAPYFRTQALARLVPALYQGSTILLVVGGLGALYVVGTEELASLGAVVLLLVRALTYSQNVQSVYHSLSEQSPNIELVREALAVYQAAESADGNEELPAVDSVTFENVSFSYVPGRPVLSDISFTVEAGEVIGIVGPSGVGKSTLVQLLLRLRTPTEGRVLVNEVPVARFTRESWNRKVAYVPQDSRVVSADVAENIRFFRPWVGDNDIEWAARHAQIHDDIMAMSNGYSTLIGQRSEAVSGGQRQRIVLARALSGKPDVLVLDEPTSALDRESENLIQRSLEVLRGTMTIFLVTHRSEMLESCDRIMVLGGQGIEAFAAAADLHADSAFFRRTLELAEASKATGGRQP